MKHQRATILQALVRALVVALGREEAPARAPPTADQDEVVQPRPASEVYREVLHTHVALR